jgi:hypothetical protein
MKSIGSMPHAALETFYVLLLALVLTAWAEQDSIALYWRQSHHKEAPFEYLKVFPVWRSGALLNEASTQLKAFFANEVAAVDVRNLEADPPRAGSDIQTAPPQICRWPSDLRARLEIPDLPKVCMAKERDAMPSSSGLPEKALAIALGRKDRVLFVGDSLMQGVAPHVNVSLYKRYAIRSLDLSRQSTGLAYPGFFDWPRQVKEVFLEKQGIKLMVVFLGPNDPWDFPNPQGGPYLKFRSEAWENVYRGRIREMLEIAQKNGAKVLWLAPPCMREQDLNRNMVYLSELFSDEVKSHQEFFLRAGDLIGCDGERFVSFMGSGEKKIKSRFDDGIHFTRAGQKRIAEEILSFIRFTPSELAR